MLNRVFLFVFLLHHFRYIIEDGIKSGIWNSDVSTEYLSSLYMGIPVSLNIEMILNSEEFDYMSFCRQMLKLIMKILSK